MSVLERELKKSIQTINYYSQNLNVDYTFKEKSLSLITNTFEQITSNLVQILQKISPDILVELSESALNYNEYSTIDISDKLLKIYFELETTTTSLNKNNFYIRALLTKAQIEAKNVERKNLKAEEAITCLKTSIAYIMKAIEVIQKPENKAKYSFLTYNASIITFNIIRNYIKPNWSKNFFDVLEKISLMMEEADDVDYNWRLRILIKLAQCYIDADKKAEGGKALDKITDLLKKKGESDFQEELLRYRIHLSRDNNGALGNIKKEVDSSVNNPSFKFIYSLQCIKSGVIPDNNLEKEAQTLITSIYSDFFKVVNTNKDKTSSTVSIKIDPWKTDVLAELSYILLKSKLTPVQNLAMNIYDFLTGTRNNSLKGKIFLENLRAQIIIIKLENELKVNNQPEKEILNKRIESRTESLRILERNLSGVSRINDLDLLNDTCILIFNTSIPFMKKSFRKNYQKAFQSASEMLEQTNSNESQLRASLHFELAKCYLDDDLLQEADTNLIKALTLDYSVPVSKLSTIYPFKFNEPNTNYSYLQRNLEQFLVYLKRSVGVKTNIYGEPENQLDHIIFECDNIKNSKHEEVKVETIKKCVGLIQSFSIEDFKVETYTKDKQSLKEKDLVDEEIAELKTKYDLKVYDDKKHFTLASLDIARLAYEFNQLEAVLKICEAMNKYQLEWNNIKDIDQILALAEVNLLCAKSFEEFLLNDGIEIGTNEVVNFNNKGPEYVIPEPDKERFKAWKQNLLNNLKESNRLAVTVSQHWFIFNIAIHLWNCFLPIIKSPTFVQICNENVIPVMADLFDSLNNAMIYYESIGADSYDTDIFTKIEIFVNLISTYTRLLEAKGRPDECIRVCDVMLTRKMNSNQRKVFDTIKSRALRSESGGKKGANVSSNQNKNKNAKGAGNVTTFTPSADQLLISDIFQTLEAAVLAKDDKSKVELLKKGMDMLKNVKVNYNDEASLELNAELWYKYGVQFFAFNNYVNYKLALLCADNCVKTFKESDIFSNNNQLKISITLLKWYCVGFLLYGDCIYKLVDKDKQERLSQIKLYFTSLDKLIQSAKLAEKGKQFYIILQSLKAFYTVVIQVIDQPQSKEMLVTKFLEFHKILVNNRTAGSILYSDSEFLLLFYSFFCLCINEAKNWELGEQVISESLKIIPSSFHHFLLEHKLFYYSKLGKSFMNNLSGGESNPKDNKESAKKGSSAGANNSKDIMTKAKLFTKLARSSTNKNDQFNSYTKAVDLLKNDQNILVCDVIFELATWLYKNNFNSEDIEDNLIQAADILLEIEPIFDDEEDLEEDGNNSLYSKRTTSSRRSRLSKRSKSKSKVSESKKRGSVSNANTKGRNSNKSSKSRTYSAQDSRTKTVFAKILDSDPYPLYINITHLEQLFCIHVFLSITAEDYRKKQEYLLDAFFFLMKIFEISFKTLNCIEFYEKNKEEISKMSLDNEVNPLNVLVSNYYVTKELNVPQVHILPDNLDNWINFYVPESFTKRSAEENSNAASNTSLPNGTFFCKKSFQKPYQFYYYLRYMVDKFLNEFYFHTQCIPLLKFSVLFSEFVLENNDLKYIYTMKLRRLFHNIIHNNSGTDFLLPIDNFLSSNPPPVMTMEKRLKHREELKKFDINLNTDNEGSFRNDNYEQDNKNAVVLVDYIREHVVWIELAEELFNQGYFNYSKDFLEEAVFHSLVLKDKLNFIKANLILAKILFIEASFDSSFNLLVKIQTLNQDFDLMFDVMYTIINVYEYLKKYDELIQYLKNLVDFLSSYKGLINASTKDKIVSFAIITTCKANMKKLQIELLSNSNNKTEESNLSSIDNILKYYKNEILIQMKKFEEITFKTNFNTIYNIFAIIEYIELTIDILITKNNLFTYVTLEQLTLISNDVLEKCLTYLIKSQAYLNNLQTFVPARVESSVYYLAIHRLLAVVKIKYAGIYNMIGGIKSRIKREHKLRGKIKLEDGKTENEENRVETANSIKYNQQVIDLINSLTKEISKMNENEESSKDNKMNLYQKSISLLSSTESLVPPNSKEFVMYFIEKVNSYRLQALHNKELKIVWDIETLNKINSMSAVDLNNPDGNTAIVPPVKIKEFHQTTLNFISEFESNLPALISTPYYYPSFKDFMKYYYNVLESSGYLNIELSFKSLCDFQNMFSKIYFSEVLDRYMDPLSRDWVSISSFNISKAAFNFNSVFTSHDLLNNFKSGYINSISYPDSIGNWTKYSNELPYLKNLFAFSPLSSNNTVNSWNDIKSVLSSSNSSYFIFQMNEDRSILYIGFMYVVSGNFSYIIKRLRVDNKTNQKLDEVIQVIKKMKHTMIKTVIITKEDLNKVFDEYNAFMAQLISLLEKEMIFTPIFNELNKIINPDATEEATIAAVDKKTGKPPVQSLKKDANKNSGVPDVQLPTSGIESVTFLIDYRFYELPFEHLSLFGKIPYKANDFSMHCLVMRMKQDSNISAPVKYYFDYSSKMPLKIDIKKSLETKLAPSSKKEKDKEPAKNEGLVSYDHYPSIPELQKLLSSSGTFLFTSQTSFLYQFPPYDLLDSSKFSKCKIAFILDRISNVKNFVDQKSLIPTHFAFSYQPLDLIALFTLIGTNTILTSKWSLDYDEASELIDDVLEETAKGFPMSYCLNKYRNPKTVKKNAPVEVEDKKKKVTEKNKKPEENKEVAMNSNENILETVVKKEIHQLAPVIFGLNSIKLYN